MEFEEPMEYEILSAVLTANLTHEGRDAYLKAVLNEKVSDSNKPNSVKDPSDE